MKGLFHDEDFLRELVSDQDLADWDPAIGECCTAEQFKLHFRGTPCNPWNKSATRVFVNDFLATHAEIYPPAWPVRRMVTRKTTAHIKSLIKSFRGNRRGEAIVKAAKQAKNRQERKATVSLLVQLCASAMRALFF